MRKLFHNLAISGHGNERRPAQVLVERETIGAVLDPGEGVAADRSFDRGDTSGNQAEYHFAQGSCGFHALGWGVEQGEIA